MRLPLSCRSVEDPGHCNRTLSQVEAQTQCVLLNHRPTSFHSGRRAARTVRVRDLPSGRDYEVGYDKLILSPGAVPIRPEVAGINLPSIFTLRDLRLALVGSAGWGPLVVADDLATRPVLTVTADDDLHTALRRMTELNVDEDGGVRLRGELEIRGEKREVEASGRFGQIGADLAGNARVGLSLAATVDRRNFGLDWQAELPSGGEVLDYAVSIAVELELVAEGE